MRGKRAVVLVSAVAVVAAAVVAVVWVGWRSAGGVHRMDAGDDGAVVEAVVGEQIVLELEGNATTGWVWEVTSADAAVLIQAGVPDYAVSSDADGAGGTYTFRFDVVGPGQTELVLQYFPSWEEPSPASGRFIVTVVAG